MSLDSASAQHGAPAHRPTATVQTIGTRWAISAGHPLAAEAGARVLVAGGNAIDAGVAGGITLGVVHPDMVSVAGVAPILVHVARAGETFQVSGVGPYPRASSREYFLTRHGGQIPPGLPRTVVPAAPDAWCTALERWGTMSFADVAAAATEHAARGFPVSAFSAYQMGSNVEKYRRWPSSVALYLRDGRAYRMGEVLVQKELADTLARMAAAEKRAGGSRAAGVRAARDEFYRGETARRIAEFHRANDGPLTAADLADFGVEVGPALRTTFGAYEVAACGFWCQGPSLLQMLNLLEGVDLVELGHNSPTYLHRLIETVKLAFADRDAYYGDPNFVKVPADRLLSKAYAAARRELVRERAWKEMPPAGEAAERREVLPLAGGSDALDTSYVAVVDAEGNGFSATPSDPNVDSPAVSGVGCVVSPRGSQGWLDPAHASVVAPGKRPRLTPAPAMAFTDGKLLMPFGTPGGDVQQQAMLQVFLNTTVWGMSLQEAIEAPRLASRSFPDSFWPHAYSPGKVEAERRLPRDTRDGLVALGHDVVDWPEWEWRAGAVCGVKIGPEGTRWGGADPRRGALSIAR
ncbi:MAG: gamma-glutamyltransferase family protein [Candidatus Rokuibacteriota bacterium]|nr:MAG: gamma-glutamyltransferase family protein [Candidatus Rokubacteria bacterium]